ncbi:MAG: hypothetical protein AAF707_03865 [Pseudomonadota bacterium]
MSALPPEQMRAMRIAAAPASPSEVPRGSLADRWQELHEQADQLAKLARLSQEPFTTELAALPAQMSEASEWQRELAWQALEDIEAMMRPGLAALRTLTSRAQNAQAPALALWREFHNARGAVLSLVNPAAVAAQPLT